jgi:hypothetical protein
MWLGWLDLGFGSASFGLLTQVSSCMRNLFFLCFKSFLKNYFFNF